MDDFIMVTQPRELLLNELTCFHTKIPLREQTLGIGFTFKKNNRTGLIAKVNASMDLISMRAFTKMKIRNSLDGDRFTHWLPLYFGENEVYEVEDDSDSLSNSDDQSESYAMVRNVDTKERFEKLF